MERRAIRWALVGKCRPETNTVAGVETSGLLADPSIVETKAAMIRKLKSGEYRLYSRKKNPKTGKRRNLGTFTSLEKAKAHERAVQYFKRH
jgi:hypothetical protein